MDRCRDGWSGFFGPLFLIALFMIAVCVPPISIASAQNETVLEAVQRGGTVLEIIDESGTVFESETPHGESALNASTATNDSLITHAPPGLRTYHVGKTQGVADTLS